MQRMQTHNQMSCKGVKTLLNCQIFYFLFPVSAIILLWTQMKLTDWLWYHFEGLCSRSCHQKQPFLHSRSIHALATASYFSFHSLQQFNSKNLWPQPGLSICFPSTFSLFLSALNPLCLTSMSWLIMISTSL